jgi:hypothetical protein
MVAETFGALTVLAPLFDDGCFLCRCHCGAEVRRTTSYLLNCRIVGSHECTIYTLSREIAEGGNDFWGSYLRSHAELRAELSLSDPIIVQQIEARTL